MRNAVITVAGPKGRFTKETTIEEAFRIAFEIGELRKEGSGAFTGAKVFVKLARKEN